MPKKDYFSSTRSRPEGSRSRSQWKSESKNRTNHGFMWKNTYEKTKIRLAQISDVMAEHGRSVTVRQVFYRLVAEHGYDKTEQAYGNLCNTIKDARNRGDIPFDAIRDDRLSEAGGDRGTCGSPQSHIKDLVAAFKKPYYYLDVQRFQPYNIVVWCEAAGMVPQLSDVCLPYDVPVFSTSGFDSTTVKYQAAIQAFERYGKSKQPTLYLHIGDFDPSGVSIYEALQNEILAYFRQFNAGQSYKPDQSDAEAWAHWSHCPTEGEPEFERVALTVPQVVEMDLPTAPPKKTDSRSKTWRGIPGDPSATVQAEAIPPKTLQSILRETIESHFDLDLLEKMHEARDRRFGIVRDMIGQFDMRTRAERRRDYGARFQKRRQK